MLIPLLFAALMQISNYTPVTKEMMLNPSPDDWLMMSRTYDEQRFSPLKQINKQNVSKLQMAWSRGLTPGIHEHIPLVHNGVMYVAKSGRVGTSPTANRLSLRAADMYRSSNAGETDNTSPILSKP